MIHPSYYLHALNMGEFPQPCRSSNNTKRLELILPVSPVPVIPSSERGNVSHDVEGYGLHVWFTSIPLDGGLNCSSPAWSGLTCCLVTWVHILFENSVPTQSLVIWSYFETWFRNRDNRGPRTSAFADRPGKGEAAPSPQRPGQLVHWRVQPATRVVGKRFLS